MPSICIGSKHEKTILKYMVIQNYVNINGLF